MSDGSNASVEAPVLELDGLEVRLGGNLVLNDLTGSVSGRAIGLLGPNGAGKTTLIHTLLGFFKPAAGTARVLGHDVRREPSAVRSLTGYMPEGDSFIANMSGVRFVRLLTELSGLPPSKALERTHEALFYVGLGEARYREMGSYSTGMKQKAKLAQALAHGPRLLFLDEPTNGLDPPARERMLRLIRDIRDSGRARIVLSSHLLRDVELCCDQVLILKEGEIARYADLKAERQSDRRLFEVEVRGDQAGFLAAAEALGCEISTHGRRGVKMVLPPRVEITQLYRVAHEREVEIRRLVHKRDSLEDIFLDAMGILGPEDAPPPPAVETAVEDALEVDHGRL